MENGTWQELYQQAVTTCQPRDVSPTVYAGSVAAAVLTANGHVYTGISVDTACSLGYCAERNALGNMLTAGDTVVTKMVAVRGETLLMPCGACREFMMQLGTTSPDIEILVNLRPVRTVKLAELMPHYWQASVENDKNGG